MNDSHAPSDIALERERLSKLSWFESGKPCRTEIFHERDFAHEQEAIWGKWGAQGIGRLRTVMLTPPSECEVRPVFAEEPAYYRLYRRRLLDLHISPAAIRAIRRDAEGRRRRSADPRTAIAR
ncbi:MAG TPA: hypothetical protein VKV24_17215 [Casimicrobiaceae bacterium]|nr:hypothetical protein [Thermoanaerobaculia bacterium]HLX30222.1 hypothetical protein [Casimicrobiaceae bacterium]